MSEIIENLDVEPDANLASLPAVDFGRKKRRILLMLFGYSALFGVLVVISLIFNPQDKPSLMNIVISIPWIALILWWYVFTEANVSI